MTAYDHDGHPAEERLHERLPRRDVALCDASYRARKEVSSMSFVLFAFALFSISSYYGWF